MENEKLTEQEILQKIEQYKNDQRIASWRMNELQNKLREIKARNGEGYVISDHALMRYLERIKGIDMGAIRKEISELPEIKESYLNGNGGDIELSQFTIKVNKGAITTFIHKNKKK